MARRHPRSRGPSPGGDRPSPGGRGSARPADPGPACRGDRRSGSRAVPRAGRKRQDHDTRRADRLARGPRVAARPNRRDRLQQARGRRAGRAGRRRARAAWRSTRHRPDPDVPCAWPRDPPLGRTAGRAAGRPRRPPAVDPADGGRGRATAAGHGHLDPQARAPSVGRGRRRGSGRRTASPGVRRLRAGACGDRWTRFRRPGRGGADGARDRPRAPRLVAGGLRRAARRRGPGRRSVAARAGAPARRAGQPDLPRRRRRPVDLRLATGRRAAGPPAGRAAARTAAARPRRRTSAVRHPSSSARCG